MTLELTMEQQFLMVKLDQDVDQLTHQDAKKMLLEVMRQNMVKDNVIRYLVKKI